MSGLFGLSRIWKIDWGKLINNRYVYVSQKGYMAKAKAGEREKKKCVKARVVGQWSLFNNIIVVRGRTGPKPTPALGTDKYH